MSNGIDIATLEAVTQAEDAGRWFNVKNAAGEPVFYTDAGVKKNVRIKVAGSYSKKYQDVSARQRDAALEKPRHTKATSALIDESNREIVVGVTLAWEGFFNAGAPWPCVPANVTSVYTVAPWIQADAEETIYDHAGFSKTDSTS